MFVFPAFDSNFSNRKRSYRGCDYCRLKRVKCSFTVNGCSNCLEKKVDCSLLNRGSVFVRNGANGHNTSIVEPNHSLLDDKNLDSCGLDGVGSRNDKVENHRHLSNVKRLKVGDRPVAEVMVSDSQCPGTINKVGHSKTRITCFCQRLELETKPSDYSGLTSSLTLSDNHNFHTGTIHKLSQKVDESFSKKPSSSKKIDLSERLFQSRGLSSAFDMDLHQKEIESSSFQKADMDSGGSSLYPRPTSDKFTRTSDTVKDQERDQLKLSNVHSTPLITKQFLKSTFDFIVSSSDHSFTYLLHNHPKVVMSFHNTRNHHESGVHIKNMRVNDSEWFIRNEKVYKFLVSIDAFTLGIEKDDLIYLLKVYFFKINSIFPIVYEKAFWEDFHENKTQSLLIYSIILVILRDKLAELTLKKCFNKVLTDLNFQQKLITFMTDLEFKIRQLILILPQLGIDDKFTMLKVSLLLSLHFNFNSFGNETNSHDLTDAVNLAMGLGIHMKNFGELNPSMAEYSKNLFWCCFIFDRFNAINNSRCLFVRADDFNIDLPFDSIKLLKLVQLAKSIEDMVSAVYRPFNTTNLTVTRDRYRKFNIIEFENIEFSLCNKEKADNYNSLEVDSDLFNVDEYAESTINLLIRILNNAVIVLGQKAKYDDPTIPDAIPELAAFNAALNINWYFERVNDSLLLNICILPWAISVPLALALKRKARDCLRLQEEQPIALDFTWEDTIRNLERLSSSWWIVDEICKQARDFVQKLEANHDDLKRLQNLNEKRIRITPEPSNFSQDLSNNVIVNMDISDIQFDKYFESIQFDIYNDELFDFLNNDTMSNGT